MDREKIYQRLQKWADSNIMLCKSKSGHTLTEINKMIADEALFATSFESIVFTNKKARDEFEDYVKSSRVQNMHTLKARTNLLTLYAITMACANGEYLRFAALGKTAILYIK